ncbi:MAG: AAA family ATPase [Anaerolineae bacterium]|nr:AAA family ATPase [Anaerolineae bacterium]
MATLKSIQIQGYRPFRDFTAQLGRLELLVGANGTGKTALFEFLKFLRDSTYQEIPPEIVAGSIGKDIFHRPGKDQLQWGLEIDLDQPNLIYYDGQINGPIGRTQVAFERVVTRVNETNLTLMETTNREGWMQNLSNQQQGNVAHRANQLALSLMTNSAFETLYQLRDYVLNWRFYSAFRVNLDKIRRPVVIEQDPILHEDCGNLGSVLFYLLTEHPSVFDDLQDYLKMLLPDFQGLSLKARGRGEVMIFWQERNISETLSLADVSDGILYLLCWTTLAMLPHPPTLICVDEPEQGVHPRTLFVLADLFQRLGERTQVLLATHNSYFLTLFPLETLAILRKEDGQTVFRKPINSEMMTEMLDDFSPDSLQQFHRSNQLEYFS